MLGDPIARRALAELAILAIACGPLGVWVLLHRQSYAAESMSHAMLPGLVLAALAGVSLELGGAAGVLVAAVAIALASRDERVGSDAGVAVAVAALFGLGGLLALSPAVPPRLSELLFGDLLGVTGRDLAVAAALSLGVLAALLAAHRPLAAAAFDRSGARALGASPARWELVLLILLGIATVAAAPGLGNLLVVALILAPGAGALALTRRLAPALVLATALAGLAGLGGIALSYYAGVAAGGAVALCAVVPALGALMLQRG